MISNASSNIGVDKNGALLAKDNGQNDRVSNNLFPVFKIKGGSYTFSKIKFQRSKGTNFASFIHIYNKL